MIQLRKLTKPTLISLIWLMCIPIMARDFGNSRFNHRIISINPGYTFSGAGDCWGINNEISHLKTFLPWLFHRESLDGWIVSGTSWIDEGYENQTGLSLTAEIGVAPFKTGNRILYLSGGGTLGFLSNISPTFGSVYYPYNGGAQTYNRIAYIAGRYFSPGISLSAGYITQVNSKIYLNIRAQAKVYNSGDVISTLSIGIGLNALKK